MKQSIFRFLIVGLSVLITIFTTLRIYHETGILTTIVFFIYGIVFVLLLNVLGVLKISLDNLAIRLRTDSHEPEPDMVYSDKTAMYQYFVKSYSPTDAATLTFISEPLTIKQEQLFIQAANGNLDAKILFLRVRTEQKDTDFTNFSMQMIDDLVKKAYNASLQDDDVFSSFGELPSSSSNPGTGH